MRKKETKNEVEENKIWEEKIKPKDLKYETKKVHIWFQQFEKIRFFVDNIYTCKINVDAAEMDQNNLLNNMLEFNDKSRPKTKEDKSKKSNTYKSVNVLYKGRELTLNAFQSGISPKN